MKSVFAFLGDIWPSIVAAVLAVVGAFLSLGLLGLVLYQLVSPALGLGFPPLDEWDQTVVWPLTIAAPIVWAPSFVPAGILNRRLSRAGWPRWRRIVVYVALIWIAAVASWWFLLSVNPDVWR